MISVIRHDRNVKPYVCVDPDALRLPWRPLPEYCDQGVADQLGIPLPGKYQSIRDYRSAVWVCGMDRQQPWLHRQAVRAWPYFFLARASGS